MMTAKHWVAAGSSAAVLAGGLFMGAPAAHADTCAPAGAQGGLIAAADNVHDAGVHFNSLVTDPETLAELEDAQVALESAIVHDDTKGGAEAAWNTILGLQESYAMSTEDAAVDAAWASASVAALEFRAAALASGVHMEDGAWLVAAFEENCGPLITGIGGDWGTGAGTGHESASGVNQGWNMQTGEESQLDTGLLAGLLAAGAALAGAVAFRMRCTRT